VDDTDKMFGPSYNRRLKNFSKFLNIQSTCQEWQFQGVPYISVSTHRAVVAPEAIPRFNCHATRNLIAPSISCSEGR